MQMAELGSVPRERTGHAKSTGPLNAVASQDQPYLISRDSLRNRSTVLRSVSTSSPHLYSAAEAASLRA